MLNDPVLKKTAVGVDDDDVLFTIEGAEVFDTFLLLSATGAVDVQVSLDGTNWSSAISLADLGAVTNDPVVVTAAGRLFGFRGKFAKVRVLQNGGTAADCTMICGTM